MLPILILLLLSVAPAGAHVRDPTPRELAVALDPRAAAIRNSLEQAIDDRIPEKWTTKQKIEMLRDQRERYPGPVSKDLARPDSVPSDQPTSEKEGGYWVKRRL